MTQPASDLEAVQRDLFCARCGYNLRGLSASRCPECGIIYDAADFAAGRLRENVRCLMDGGDLWRPLDVLWRSLATLLSATLRPVRTALAVELRGSRRVTATLWLVALAWDYVLISLLASLAVGLHWGVSPAGSLRAGFVLWGPPLVGKGMVAAMCWTPMLVVAARTTTTRLTWEAAARLLALATPALVLTACGPLAVGLVVAPEFVLGSPLRVLFLLLTIIWTAFVLRALAPRARVSRRETGCAAAWWCIASGACLVLAFLTRGIVPSTLEPPLDFFLR